MVRRHATFGALVTRLGPIDVVLEPKAFEEGVTAFIGRSTRGTPGRRRRPGRGLVDLIRSKALLHWAKDVEHLAVPYEQFPELEPGFAS